MDKFPNSYIRYCVRGINEDNESIFPERVSTETLLELKLASSYTFYSQVQQEPKAFSGEFFLVEKTSIMPLKEFRQSEWMMRAWIRAWDFAGTSKESKSSHERKDLDYTRGVLCCTDGKKLYICHVATHRGTIEGNATLLVKNANSDGFSVTITTPIDPGHAGEAYHDYLQSLPELGGHSLVGIRPTQNKNLRASGFASFLNLGNVVIVSDEEDDVKWNNELLTELAAFPMGAHDDMCLIGDTEIATIFGNKKIKNVKKGDIVLTPIGPKKVLESKYTGYVDVIETKYLTGKSSHPVFDKNEFRRLDSLTGCFNILSWKCLILWMLQKQFYLTEQNIERWEGKESIISLSQIQIPSEKILKAFMFLFMNFILEAKYQKAFTFIIKTAIHSITTTIIWSVYLLLNTTKKRTEKLKQLKRILTEYVHSQQHGIDQKKVENGIVKTVKHVKESIKICYAFIVQKNFNQSLVIQNIAAKSAVNFTDFIPTDISCQKYAKNASLNLKLIQEMEKKSDSVLNHVQENLITKKAKVYNLQIEDASCYYANGILVGNCDCLSDAFTYLHNIMKYI